MREAQFADLKAESLKDAALVGLLGAACAFAASGPDAAEGLVLGCAAGSFYLTLLHIDVDALGSPAGRTPFDAFNLLRIVRLLVPLVLLLCLSLQTALVVGVDTWLAGLAWEPGRNFVGFVAPPQLLLGALLGYVLPSLALRLKGLARAVPEVRDLVSALPGSVGVAVKLSQDAEKRKARTGASKRPAAKAVPILLVSGPRGCGKTTLAQRLSEADPRFSEPVWVVTSSGGSTSGARSRQRKVGEAEFQELAESGSLAVNYRPYGEDGEQVDLGLPALAVLAAAAETGACILDVDPATARTLLSYDWDRALSALSGETLERLELRLIAVWVTLPSLDAVVERNRQWLETSLQRSSAVERQLSSLRTQATSDIEWALTSGSFDFTVMNQDVDAAVAEVTKASSYCFADY